jgi:hypothetical protein
MYDVRQGCKFFAEKLIESGSYHDHTKLNYIDEFYDDFSKVANEKRYEDFKKLDWWQKHLIERHHLNDKVPKDVNLIDVLEMMVDGCMAGMARSGSVYDIRIDSETLHRAVKNTQKLLLNNVKVVD